MGTFTKGEIVLFPFPFTDLSNRKLRPCLILSDEMREDILLCQITSQRIQGDSYSIDLKKDNSGLIIDSYIRCNMLFTAEKSQIVRRVSKLDKKKYSEVVKMINSIIC
jgi:mRNA interferase MazF